MKPQSIGEPVYISNKSALERLAGELLREQIIAVDTESNSLHAYQERVCLIQFSTYSTDYLVDPIVLKNVSPLEPVFSSSRVEKVFHAAEYDLICLHRDFEFNFSNLFDTMIAAGILGYPALGLGSLLKDKFGVRINKRYQRANWGERPLPMYLKLYAQQDTHYLLSLRDLLRRELIERNLVRLAVEDFKRLSRVKAIKKNAYQPGNVEQNFWRVNGSNDLVPQKAAVLLELCRYRDEIARKRDLPLFKVLSDRTLLSIAEQTPVDLDELNRVPGVSDSQVKRHGAKLLVAVQTGMQAKPIYPPKRTKSNGKYLYRVDNLKQWRKITAQNMGVGPDVILPRDLLFKVAKRNPHSLDELAEVFKAVPWRMEHFGEEIIAVLKD
ncbi:MAG: ribonuclease D [Anaerolineales bacterium]|jgi:ribonuclease D